jgi:threonine/homoserine/homoserine lactone efflux protein
VTSVASGLTELIPLALIIAISPLSIIPGILVLHTPRPRPTSLAFLAGWVLGIAVITGAFVGGSDVSNQGLDDKPGWSPYVRIVIGVALIVFGLYRWFGRHRSAHNPKWMTAMGSMGPGRAFLTGIVLTVANLKVFAMCAAAGVAIGTAALGRPGAWQAVLVFTALAASTVALPALAYLFAGPRLDQPLERVKTWMERNHAALVAGILLVIGAGLLYKGIHAL